MFKIEFSRNINGRTPEECRKIDGIDITIGYHCYNCRCPQYNTCKYRKSFHGLHMMRYNVHRFFERRLHIKLPYVLNIHKLSSDLSGTTTCPHNEPRRYSCYDCKFCDAVDENCDVCCGNQERYLAIKEGRYTIMDDFNNGNDYCRYFEKSEYADRYDTKTGLSVYDDTVT